MQLLLYANENFKPYEGHPDYNHISIVIYFGIDFCLHCLRGCKKKTPYLSWITNWKTQGLLQKSGERNTQGWDSIVSGSDGDVSRLDGVVSVLDGVVSVLDGDYHGLLLSKNL